jgi:hypothetical protein
MNKTQTKKEINRRFYIYVETNFPQYELEFDNGCGRVSLVPKEGEDRGTNSIDYHQSDYSVVCLNFASKETKENTLAMQTYINNNIIPFVNTFIEV